MPARDTTRASVEALDETVRKMLLEDLPRQRDAIITAIEAERWREARDVVHAVNGAASFCHLHELGTAAAHLEHLLDAGYAERGPTRAFVIAINDVLSSLE